MAESQQGDGLVIEGLSHRFADGRQVLHDVSLSVAPSEVVCLLGPSGCGKSTTLRLIAGLEELQHGRILAKGRVLADATTSLPPEERKVSLVFQDFALFPHLNVLDNVLFGLRQWPSAKAQARAIEVLEQVGMAEYTGAYPHTLSGGQQQRVAIARARAPQPQVLLLDEPFSNLDVALRDQVRDSVLHRLKRSRSSTLFVTHDPEEAMFMADRIAVMNEGRIVQAGTPLELYRKPATAFVAALFGDVNRFTGTVAGGTVETPLGPVAAPGLADGTPAVVLIRPEGVRLGAAGAGTRRTARVMASRLLGADGIVHLSIGGNGGDDPATHIHVRTAGDRLPAENEQVPVSVDPSESFVFADRDAT